jgi:multicomponent Na+:H+ antiporter subunit B
VNGQNDRREEGMSLIVKTIARLTVGLSLLFGVYIALHGHFGPGGGFAGGVIIALSLIELVLAFGRERVWKKFGPEAALPLIGLGALIFLAIALFGYAAGAFFQSWLPAGQRFALLGAGTIPLSEIAVALAVAGGIYIFFTVMSAFSSGHDDQEKP